MAQLWAMFNFFKSAGQVYLVSLSGPSLIKLTKQVYFFQSGGQVYLV